MERKIRNLHCKRIWIVRTVGGRRPRLIVTFAGTVELGKDEVVGGAVERVMKAKRCGRDVATVTTKGNVTSKTWNVGGGVEKGDESETNVQMEHGGRASWCDILPEAQRRQSRL